MKRFFLLIFSFLLIPTDLCAGKGPKSRSAESFRISLKFCSGKQRKRPDFKKVKQLSLKKKSPLGKKSRESLYKLVLDRQYKIKQERAKKPVSSLFPSVRTSDRVLRQAKLVKRLENMRIEQSRPILRLYAMSKGVWLDTDHELGLPSVKNIRDVEKQAKLMKLLVKLFPEEALPIIKLFLKAHENQESGYSDRF